MTALRYAISPPRSHRHDSRKRGSSHSRHLYSPPGARPALATGLIGDLDQVDTPYLDGKSNGLIHTHERMKGHAITANVRLISGVRSALSELAAQLM